MDTIPRGEQQKVLTRVACGRSLGTYGGGPALSASAAPGLSRALAEPRHVTVLGATARAVHNASRCIGYSAG